MIATGVNTEEDADKMSPVLTCLRRKFAQKVSELLDVALLWHIFYLFFFFLKIKYV